MGVKRDIAMHAYELANARSQENISWCRDLIDKTLAASDSDLGYLVVSSAILQSVNEIGLFSLKKKLKKRRQKREKRLEKQDELRFGGSQWEMEKRLAEFDLRHNHDLFFAKYLIVNGSSKAANANDFFQRLRSIRETGVDVAQIDFCRVIDDLLNCELEGDPKDLKKHLDAIAYSGDTYNRALEEIESRLPYAMG